MTDTTVIDTARLQRAQHFDLQPDAAARADLAAALSIPAIKKVRLTGTIAPDGARDLRLEATLGATVVQDCIVTGAPVTTRLDEPVLRQFIAGLEMPEGDEVEMPEDDTIEPMPPELDLTDVMAEALALALPPWPRADGVDPVDITVTAPGIAPMTDEDARPFAVLKDLKAKLDGSAED